MKFSPGIKGIYLGGFQIFDEVTFIPLSQITLLYGPNSSGKSSIEDGLKLIQQEVFTSNMDDKKDYEFDTFASLKPHWRRTTEELNALSSELTLGFRFESDVSLVSALGSGLGDRECTFINELWHDNEFDLVDYIIKYRIVNDQTELSYINANDIFLARDLEFSINEKWIINIRGDEFVDLNFDHPLFIFYPTVTNFKKVSEKYPEVFQVIDGTVRLLITHTKLFTNREVSDKEVFYYVMASEIETDIPDDLISALDEFILYYESLLPLVLSNIRFRIGNIVPASRVIPKKEDLCFISANEQYEELIDSFHLKMPGDSTFSQLAWNENVRSKVNQMFTEHLFVERGYLIDTDTLNITLQNEWDPTRVATIKRLFLIDSQGRKFAFDEVGSGLGYVLPVICSVCTDREVYDSTFSLIQQPELHLHPALQAALGDIFIECAVEGRQIVIETHSEHLILRILKRIRQTSLGFPISSELLIKPDQVAVLYFDSTPNGVTKVKHIRVSEDGEFLDRWPRGFFSERDMELFDE